MKRMRMILMLLAVLAVLSGCAGTLHVKDAPAELGEKFDLTMHPELSVGVRITPALEAGNVTVIESPMPDGQVGEGMFPGKFNYSGWARNKNGQEGYAQFVFIGNYKTGEFMSFVIIDGKFSEMKSAKLLPISTKASYTWDKYGDIIPIDRVKFYREAVYREELVKKYGISIGERHLVRGFDSIVRSWNLYGTAYGDIYSPYSLEDIQQFAKINTGYKFTEKLVLKNKAVISINPVEMITKAAITVFGAMKTKERGFDLDSELPSQAQMVAIIQFAGKFRLELIRQLNAEIAEKDAKIAALKKEKKAR